MQQANYYYHPDSYRDRCVTPLCVLNFVGQELTTKYTKEDNTKITEISPCSLCKNFVTSVVKKNVVHGEGHNKKMDNSNGVA